eukprot:3628465-Prymnesium_polylepis.1
MMSEVRLPCYSRKNVDEDDRWSRDREEFAHVTVRWPCGWVVSSRSCVGVSERAGLFRRGKDNRTDRSFKTSPLPCHVHKERVGQAGEEEVRTR